MKLLMSLWDSNKMTFFINIEFAKKKKFYLCGRLMRVHSSGINVHIFVLAPWIS